MYGWWGVSDQYHYAGADWIQEATNKPLSEFGAKCADFLGWWQRGIYHIHNDAVRADWSIERYISLTVHCWGGWSTFDNDTLTRLVIGAHDFCIRLEIDAVGPHTMRLTMHPREREGGLSKRHVTIEDAIGTARST